jgi:hypothetical protein
MEGLLNYGFDLDLLHRAFFVPLIFSLNFEAFLEDFVSGWTNIGSFSTNFVVLVSLLKMDGGNL